MAADDLPDYRKPKQREFGLFFIGKGSILIVIVIASFAVGGLIGNPFINMILILGSPLTYFIYNLYYKTPNLVAVSDATPPDLSPPQSGHMRVTILRRQATYADKRITGHIGPGVVQDELIVWVILSEVAKKNIEKHDLMDADVYVTPKSEELLEFYRSLDPALAKDKFIHHRVRDFLIDPPYLTWDRNYVEEPLIREGLKSLNDTITRLLTIPISSSKSFEL